jgi:hypothetical protein
MSLSEKLSTAQVSSNLGERPLHQIGDIDVVRACGMAGVNNSFGLAMWRLKFSGDEKELGRVATGAWELLTSRYPSEDKHLHRVRTVIAHWLNDVCEPCHGRGYSVVPGTPMLSDNPCEHCDGTGRVKLQADDAAKWLLEEMAKIEREIAVAVMRKINPRFDDE